MSDYLNHVITRSGEGVYHNQSNWRADIRDSIKQSQYSDLAYDNTEDKDTALKFESIVNTAANTLESVAASGQGYATVIGPMVFDLMVSAIKTDSNIVILSNPRIIVQENYEAKIHVGLKYPILKTEFAPSGGGTETVISMVAVGGTTVDKWLDLGISLKVIPQVRKGPLGEKMINMIVHPSVSSIKDYLRDKDPLTGKQIVTSYPVVNIRETDTNVSINNGDTLAIGGLISSNTSDIETKIPLLGDIPILGYLFKEKETIVSKTNLVIFLTASVVEEQPFSAYEKLMLEKVPPDALQDVRYTEDENLRPFLYKSAKEPPPPEVEATPEPEKESEKEGRRETKAMKRSLLR